MDGAEISTGESYDSLLGKVKGMELAGASGFDIYRYEIVGCIVLFAVTASVLYVVKPAFVRKKTLSYTDDSPVCMTKVLSYAFFITLVGCVIIVSYSKYADNVALT